MSSLQTSPRSARFGAVRAEFTAQMDEWLATLPTADTLPFLQFVRAHALQESRSYLKTYDKWGYRLPVELLVLIFGFLDPVDLCRARQVCTRWASIGADDALWKGLCARPWTNEGGPRRTVRWRDNHSWHDRFVHNVRTHRNWLSGRYNEIVVKSHSNAVRCLDFDEEIIVSGSADRTVKIWDLDTRQCINTLHGHTDSVSALAFNKQLIISGSSDTTIRLWDRQTFEYIRTLNGHTDVVRCLQFDENKVVSGSQDNTVRVWDLHTGKCTQTIVGHQKWVTCLQYDDNYIASGSEDTTVRVWDTQHGRWLRVLEGAREGIRCLQFDSASGRLVCGSSDHHIYVWDIRTGDRLADLPTKHTGSVRCLQAVGDWVVTGSFDDQTIRVWDLGKRRCVQTFHAAMLYSLRFDGRLIISGNGDGSMRIWDFTANASRRGSVHTLGGTPRSGDYD